MKNSVKFFNQYGVNVFEWQKDCGDAFVQHIRKCGGKGNMTVKLRRTLVKVWLGVSIAGMQQKSSDRKVVIVVPTTLVQTGWPKKFYLWYKPDFAGDKRAFGGIKNGSWFGWICGDVSTSLCQ